MKAKICFCPSSLARIIKHLKKSAVPKFRRMIKGTPELSEVRAFNKKIIRDFRSLKDDPDLDLKAIENIRKELKTKRKKRRTPKQIRATKKLIAFNKRRRLRR